MLKLLYKLTAELHQVAQKYNFEKSKKYQNQRTILRKVYHQQKEIFTTGKSVSYRIVSISKSCLRPIIRGKEVKQVESGATVNKIQISGINFTEHIVFRAFNQGTRLVTVLVVLNI